MEEIENLVVAAFIKNIGTVEFTNSVTRSTPKTVGITDKSVA